MSETGPSQPPSGLAIEEVAPRVKADRIYKLSSNENPLGASPAVAAASARVTPMFHLYPPRNDDSLRGALMQHHGRGLTESHFFTACGGYEAIDLLSRAFLRPADRAIICSPTFPVYASMARRAQAEVTDVPLDRETFAHNLDGILAAVTPRTRLVYLCNPNNPTGAMLSAPAMDRLLAALPAEVLVVADEAYSHYVARSDYPDSIRYVLKGCPLIVLHSFSKVYGLAGLRLGYGIARPDLIAQLWRYRRNFHLGRLELAAGIAALGDLEHVARSVKLAQEGRTYFYAALARLGVKFWPSEANFVLFQPARAAAEVCEELLERGIMVRPTEGNGLPGCLRVSTGLPEANAAFIQALSEVLHPS